MAKKPFDNSLPTPELPDATGYQLGWNKGRWIVIRGNAGSQCQTRAESQALADQLNGTIGFAHKAVKKI